jgi:hypothetical protein
MTDGHRRGADLGNTLTATVSGFGSRGTLDRAGGERFLFGFAAPLAGAALIVAAGAALAARQPEARLSVGLVAALASCVALAVLTARGLVAQRSYGLHVGAAATAFAFALLCGGPVLAAVGIPLLALGLGWGIVRGTVHEAAVLVPAVAVPVLAAALHPGVDFALVGLLTLAAASALLALGRRGAALILLAAPLVLLHASSGEGGLWLAVAVAGAGLGFAFQWVAAPLLRTSIARFALEMIALTFVMDAAVRALGNPLTAALVAAVISFVSAVGFSFVARGLSAERFACTAIFLALAAFQDSGASFTAAAALVLGLAAALQLVAVVARNVFASRVALLLSLVGAAVPLARLLFGHERSLTDALSTGLLAAAVMALFGRRVAWVGDPPWWRDLISLRSAAQLRAWMRSGWTALRDAPVVGPVMSLGQRSWALLKGFVRKEHALGLPELAIVGALVYALVLTTSFVEGSAMWAALSLRTERMFVAAIWCAVGLAAYVAGSTRQRAYLRLTGVVFVVAMLVRAFLQRDGAGTEEVTIIAGAALMLIGAASLGRGGIR